MTRLLDILIAAAGLVVALARARRLPRVAIRLESRGPVFYRQSRVGLGGAPFELWKLRTMVVGAEQQGAGLYIEAGDPRITRAGGSCAASRSTSCPTWSTCCAGEMSIVGPRPTVREQVDRYTDRQRRRLEVKPGITGWAQVNGRTALSWPERIELDVWYVDNRSLALDLQILARTAEAAGHRAGASTATTSSRAGTEASREPTAPPPRERAHATAGSLSTRRARSRGRASPRRRSGRWPARAARTGRGTCRCASRAAAWRPPCGSARACAAGAPATRSASRGVTRPRKRDARAGPPARGEPLEGDDGLHLHGEAGRGRRPQLRRSPA